MLTLALAALLAQVTPVQPIVKGTGLPPQGADETAVLAPVQALFAAMAAGDPAAALAQVRQDGSLTVAMEKPDGTRGIRHLSWAAFAAGLKPGVRREERLLDPAVDIDGDVAMVWSPYVFLADGKPEHCGTDLFDLVRENGRWTIVNVTWSQRTTGCAAR